MEMSRCFRALMCLSNESLFGVPFLACLCAMIHWLTRPLSPYSMASSLCPLLFTRISASTLPSRITFTLGNGQL